MSAIHDALINQAAGALWGAIATAFPEMTTGDSQLSGEDEGAIALWIYGEVGDRPVQEPHLDLPTPSWITSTRVQEAVEAGIDAARKVFTEAGVVSAMGHPPVDVVWQLSSCVRHVLHWNLPEKRVAT